MESVLRVFRICWHNSCIEFGDGKRRGDHKRDEDRGRGQSFCQIVGSKTPRLGHNRCCAIEARSSRVKTSSVIIFLLLALTCDIFVVRAVVYYNVQSETLAVVFRPYTDPAVIQSTRKGLLAADKTVNPVPLRGWDDEINKFIPIQVKQHYSPSSSNSINDSSVYVVSGARTVYERTEKLVIVRLNKLAEEGKLPGKRLMVTGFSSGGVFSESFAVRLTLNTPKFMLRKQFESKEILTFNAPPGFSKKGAFFALGNVLKDGRWTHRRIVGEDQNSVFWSGLVETRPRRKLYSHLGKAILVSRYPVQIGLKQYKGAVAFEIDEPDFPSELFPWTSIRTDEDAIRHEDTLPKYKLDMTALKYSIRKNWMGMVNHVMGLGLSLMEIGEAVKNAGKCTREQWSQLM
ncbi:hypothetical protein BKA69DRAFT_665894 [Paraphysoderma sedebokerense]|nr:hypothetical protein BKA69DRAFT_665894 [Paraphysoderma sedebokerense]